MHQLLDRIRFFLIISAGVLFVAAIFVSQAEARSLKQVLSKRHAPVPSWYVGVSGSVNFVDDASVTDTDTTASSATGVVTLDDGYGLNGAIGYRTRHTQTIWDNIRVEGSIGYQTSDVTRYVLNTGAVSTPTSNDLTVKTMMANMYFDFDASPNWRPYIGVGIGAARANLNSTTLGGDQEDTVFAYQGMVGLTYIPSSFPAVEMFGGYRYLATQDMEFTNTTTSTLVDMEYDSHNLEGGFRFYF